jgi:hypothetical protein
MYGPVIGSANVGKPKWDQVPDCLNDDRHLYDVNPILVSSVLASSLAERANLGNFYASIGSTTAFAGDVLFPNLMMTPLLLQGNWTLMNIWSPVRTLNIQGA